MERYKLKDIKDTYVVDDVLPVVFQRLYTPEKEEYPDILIHIKDDGKWKFVIMSERYTYTNIKSLISDLIKLDKDIDESLIKARYSVDLLSVSIPTTRKYTKNIHNTIKYLKEMYKSFELREAYYITYGIGKKKPTIYPAVTLIAKDEDDKDIIATTYLPFVGNEIVVTNKMEELDRLPEFNINQNLLSTNYTITKNYFLAFKTWIKKMDNVNDFNMSLYDAYIVGSPYLDKSNLQELMITKLKKQRTIRKNNFYDNKTWY
jgi:hypothetical protein